MSEQKPLSRLPAWLSLYKWFALELHTKAIRIVIPVLIEIWMNGTSLQLHHPTTLGATLPTAEPIMGRFAHSQSGRLRCQESRKATLCRIWVASLLPSFWQIKPSEIKDKGVHCLGSFLALWYVTSDWLNRTLSIFNIQYGLGRCRPHKPLSVKQMGDSASKNLQNTSHQIQI